MRVGQNSLVITNRKYKSRLLIRTCKFRLELDGTMTKGQIARAVMTTCDGLYADGVYILIANAIMCFIGNKSSRAQWYELTDYYICKRSSQAWLNHIGAGFKQ